MRAATAAECAHEPLAVAAPRRRKIARRVWAGVEVLVKPTVGRHKQAALDPINALLRFVRSIRIFQRAFPHQRVAATIEHHDVRAWPVAMSFLVSAGLEFGDVCLHRVVGELQFDPIVALAALLAFAQRKLSRIGHEATVPRVNASRLLALFRRGVFVVHFVRASAEEI